jgi:hypothetical protein
MIEKKHDPKDSPDISKMKVIVIDHKTKIYIQPDADEEAAILRYMNRPTAKKLK